MRTYKKRKNNTNLRTYKKTVKKSFRKTKTKKRNKTILKGGGYTTGNTPTGIDGSDSEFAYSPKLSNLVSSPSGNNPMSMGQPWMPPDMGQQGVLPQDGEQFGVMPRGVGPPPPPSLPPSLPMSHSPPKNRADFKDAMKNKKKKRTKKGKVILDFSLTPN